LEYLERKEIYCISISNLTIDVLDFKCGTYICNHKAVIESLYILPVLWVSPFALTPEYVYFSLHTGFWHNVIATARV
jgi:hypothetical protein